MERVYAPVVEVYRIEYKKTRMQKHPGFSYLKRVGEAGTITYR